MLLAVAAVAGEDWAAWGVGCWNPPGDAVGASLRYVRVQPQHYLQLDCVEMERDI